MMQNIHELTRAIKERMGWSESKIASEVGVSQPTIHRILTGQTDCKGSTYQRIVALAERLKS